MSPVLFITRQRDTYYRGSPSKYKMRGQAQALTISLYYGLWETAQGSPILSHSSVSK